MKDYLFVYGSLLSVFDTSMTRLLKKHAQCLGYGIVQGKLFDLGLYPGLQVRQTPNSEVKGEVWEILDPNLWITLDQYEMISDQEDSIYRKAIVPVRMEAETL